MTKKILTNLLLLILVLPFFSINSSGQTSDQLNILHLYNLEEEKNQISDLIGEFDLPISINSLQMDNFVPSVLDSIDFIIFTSQTEFSLSGGDQDAIRNHLNDVTKSAMFLTPFIEDFNGEMETFLGVDSTDDIYPRDDVLEWEVNLLSTVGDLIPGDNFEFEGQIGAVGVENFVDVIAEVVPIDIGNDEIADVVFPLPIIFNATQEASSIITFSYSPLSMFSSSLLQLNQGSTPLEDLFRDLISISFISLAIQLDLGISLPNDPNSPSVVEDLASDIRVLILIMVMLLVFFWRRLLRLISWLFEKTMGVFIAVFGAFYKIQDRMIDENQIYLNKSRGDIIEFLNQVKEYGAHLREIKNALNLGMGALLWHLQVLEDFHKIEQIKIGKHSIFIVGHKFPQFNPELKNIEMQLQSKYTLDILKSVISLEASESISINQIEIETEISNKAIRRVINKAVELDLLELISSKPIKVKIRDKSKINKLITSFDLRFEYDPMNLQTSVRVVKLP